jgi:hypothetical protein
MHVKILTVALLYSDLYLWKFYKTHLIFGTSEKCEKFSLFNLGKLKMKTFHV